MLEDNFVKSVVILCWIIFPIIWFCYRNDCFIKFSLWWRSKDEEDVVVPTIFFFILPFLFCITYQQIYELITDSHKNSLTIVLVAILKLIPIATIGTYFLDKLKKNEEIQIAKDILSQELGQNHIAVQVLLVSLEMGQKIDSLEKQIQFFQSLWLSKAYDNNLNLIISMKKNIYRSLSDIYMYANLIINQNKSYNSYVPTSGDTSLLKSNLRKLDKDIFENLKQLDNRSETGYTILKEVEQKHKQLQEAQSKKYSI